MIEVSHQHRARRFPRRETFRVLGVVLKRESRRKMNVSVVFTNDRFMRTINRRFLNHDTVTDVIAFPLGDDRGVAAELYVNLDQAKRQAAVYGVSFREEVRRLLIHGMLHILGYRDSTIPQREAMHRRENWYLKRLERVR